MLQPDTIRKPDAMRETNRGHGGLQRRISVCFYGLCIGIALPLAAFTANGLLGLIVHGFALSGAASLFEKPAPPPPRQGDVP